MLKNQSLIDGALSVVLSRDIYTVLMKTIMAFLNMLSEAISSYVPHILLIVIMVELVALLIPYLIDRSFYAANFWSRIK